MPDNENHEISQRGMWSGTLTFGMVGIPVALFPANRRSRITVRMLAPDGTPLKRRYYCPSEERALDREDIVRGYEVSEGKYVVISDEELEALDPQKSREIDLRNFVPVAQIDPIFFDRAYFLIPDSDANKPYRLLAETMERTERAGVATFVMRGKEYLVAILAEKGILRAETLRFVDEIRSPSDLGLETPLKAQKSAVDDMAKQIRAATAAELDMEELKDEETELLLGIIRRKKPLLEKKRDQKREGGQVIDLMQVLKRRLEASDSTEALDAGDAEEKAEPLEKQSKEALYERAKALGIAGRGAMSKKKLIEAIKKIKKEKRK